MKKRFFIFSPFFLELQLCEEVLTMEEQEDGWLTVLEKNGLGPAAAIFENYGIDSETDLLVLDPDDFIKLAARGLKPLHVKKLERWCESVHEREKNMLPNAPTAAALLSSEALNVVTPAAHSVGAEASECESGAENESERDGEEDDDDSDDDLEVVGEQSGTADYIELSMQSQFNKRGLR